MKVELSPLERYIVARRLRGEMLEDIAISASERFERNITRERVRQICAMVAKRVMRPPRQSATDVPQATDNGRG